MKHIFFKFKLLAIILATFLSVNVWAQDESETNTKIGDSSHPLTGGVVLEQQLPPIDESMQVGHKFIPKAIGVDNPDNQWCLVPNWLAGTWHLKKVVSHTPFGDKIILDPPLSDKVFGQQIDKTGGIWTFVGTPVLEPGLDVKGSFLPFLHDMLVRNIIKLFYVNTDISIDNSSNSKFIERITSSILKTKDEVISNSSQCQVYELWKKSNSGIICHQIMNKYDAQGQVNLNQKADYFEELSKPFQVIDKSDDGLDYHSLFIEFLKKSGHSDLIP